MSTVIDVGMLEQLLLAKLDKSYTTSADTRQVSLGLAYISAERQDLAHTIAQWLDQHFEITRHPPTQVHVNGTMSPNLQKLIEAAIAQVRAMGPDDVATMLAEQGTRFAAAEQKFEPLGKTASPHGEIILAVKAFEEAVRKHDRTVNQDIVIEHNINKASKALDAAKLHLVTLIISKK